jgi:hypothetical protein
LSPITLALGIGANAAIFTLVRDALRWLTRSRHYAANDKEDVRYE